MHNRRPSYENDNVSLEKAYATLQQESDKDLKKTRRISAAAGCCSWSTGAIVVAMWILYLTYISLTTWHTLQQERRAAESLVAGSCAEQENVASSFCQRAHQTNSADLKLLFAEKLIDAHTGPIVHIFDWWLIKFICFNILSDPKGALLSAIAIVYSFKQFWSRVVSPCLEQVKPESTDLPT